MSKHKTLVVCIIVLNAILGNLIAITGAFECIRAASDLLVIMGVGTLIITAVLDYILFLTIENLYNETN